MVFLDQFQKIPHSPATNLDFLIAWDKQWETRSSSCQFGSATNHATCKSFVPSMSQHPCPYKLSCSMILEFTWALFCSWWNHQQTDSVTSPHAIMSRTHRWQEGSLAGYLAKNRRANTLSRGQKKCLQNLQVNLAHRCITVGAEKKQQLR